MACQSPPSPGRKTRCRCRYPQNRTKCQ
ncbi:hypothetical protein SRHO_G00306850, partial [Serrasalmus rhombeus]